MEYSSNQSPEIDRDWLSLSVADERWQTSWRAGEVKSRLNILCAINGGAQFYNSSFASYGGQEMNGLLDLKADYVETLLSVSILPTILHEEFLKKSGKKR